MDKPTPPVDGECCESGCDPCVWDTYYAALRIWEAQQAAQTKDTTSTAANAAAVSNISAPDQ